MAQIGGSEGRVGERCSMPLFTRRVCLRPAHYAPEYDLTARCIMHSFDPEKDDGEFQSEFEAILQNATEQGGLADFYGFVFNSSKYLCREFGAECIFHGAVFEDWASFSHAKFLRRADFVGAQFRGVADFTWTDFRLEASFYLAKFAERAMFSDATFNQRAHFGCAEFKEARFDSAKFYMEARFSAAVVRGFADFQHAEFMGRVAFDRTQFELNTATTIGPAFCFSQFARPELVLFNKTWLGNAIFVNTDVTKIPFTAVEWRKRSNNRCMLLEEQVDVETALPLKPAKSSFDERNYLLIAELYQQLKKNYDERRDFSTAGDFHYGEMEMKRLHSRRRNFLLRWLHRNLGLIALYKYFSAYGESYLRPFVTLLLIVLFFATIFPLPITGFGLWYDPAKDVTAQHRGLPPLGPLGPLTYTHPISPEKNLVTSKDQLRLWARSATTALDILAFQKDRAYEPAGFLGQILVLVEMLATWILIGLFLLAVNRQFRR